jgi:hypothetical protein
MSRRLVLPVALFTLATGTANATIIGSAVDLSFNIVDGGAADPEINFFIPLSDNESGVYGVGGVGQSSDACSTSIFSSDRCGGGYLGMLLEFEGASAGSHIMTLAFNDLDLAGVNDPWYFFETLAIFALDSTPSLDFVWNAFDPLVTFKSHDDQTLQVGIDLLSSGNLYVGLLFNSTIAASGSFYNTEETLVASLDRVSVPEPATLSLLGAGLLVMGFARRRKRRGI